MVKIARDLLLVAEQRKLEKGLSAMLSTLEEKRLLRDCIELVLMPSERIMLARRLQIARRLVQGKTIGAIRSELKVGQRTIENVHRWLLMFPEYRRQLPKALREARDKRGALDEIPYTFSWVRKKYPLHFLLINLILRDHPDKN